MTLADVRRYAVRYRTPIEFTTSTGAPVIIDEHGVARVEGLRAAPSFTISEEFDRATKFAVAGKAGRQWMERSQLEELAGKATAHAHDEED